MKVGFTGTSKGMTNEQLVQVHMLLGDLKTAGATQATHGMCEGADAAFHFMAKAMQYFMVGCPGVNKKGLPYKRADVECDLVIPEKPFLARNRVIVAESDLMIATPKETTEQWMGSGTWATIRYARKTDKPLIIVWPDGTGVVERVSYVAMTLEEYRTWLTVEQED